ncbi:MAG TPA: membrane protein insertase YidC [Rugosimonospora sp.]|nr:membrane protein insertase YidC [Rugosimonospora sp.]
MLEPFYWGISWILLRWHDLWSALGLTGMFLGTNWDWVLAIVFLVITVRAILFPVYVKQIKSQRAMQRLAPEIKKLQEKHKGDRESLQRETMELYRKEGTNPLMGCLPMVIQIPVMWSLFHVLRHLNPNRHEATKRIYGWTVDQFDGAAHAKLLGAPIATSFRSSAEQVSQLGANGTTVKVVAGILVVIMIVTTYMTSRQMILKTGWAEDPTQKMVQRLMLYGIPVSLLVSGFAFPIGVVLYWTTTNLFSLGQQFWVLHKYPPPPNAKTGTSDKSTAGGKTPARTPAGAKAVAGKSAPRLRGGLTRKAPEPVEANGVDGRALAPKPGAKPVNPKRTPTGRRTAAKQAAAKQAATKQTSANGNQPSANGNQQGSTNAAKRTSG